MHKAALKELRAALAAAQAAQATESATPTLIPKPRGTSGRGNFNLAKEMGVETTVYHEIQASASFHFSYLRSQYQQSFVRSQYQQSFVRSLVNMSALDKSKHWKNQPGDETHKIFTVVCLPFTPADCNFTNTYLGCREIPDHGEVQI